MIQLKCFAVNENLISNVPNLVHPIGELSSFGTTFSKEPRTYTNIIHPNIDIIHFPHKYNQLGYNEAIPQNQVDQLIEVSNHIYTRMLSGTGVLSVGDFTSYLTAQMGNAITNIKTGGIFEYDSRYIIEWLEWKNTTISQDNVYKVWFVNDSFVGQFDDYEITVVSPIEPPNLFFGIPNDVKALLNGLNHFDLMSKIDSARDDSPETFLWGKEFDYVNPTDQNDKTPAKFSVLIYGAAGNNIDSIKEAIVDYLIDNSSYNHDQWKNILPELFMRTEFMLFPQWSNIAIENIQDVNNRIYSPVADITKILNEIKADAWAGGIKYNNNYINANAQTIPLPYMSIVCGIIGHEENREGKKKITDWYKDYFFVNTASADFNKMALTTQQWVIFITQLIMLARDITAYSTVPYGYSRVVRNNKVYLSKSYNDIQFLVKSTVTV